MPTPQRAILRGRLMSSRLWDEGLVRLIEAGYVCRAAYRAAGTTISCQSAATSKIVKCCFSTSLLM